MNVGMNSDEFVGCLSGLHWLTHLITFSQQQLSQVGSILKPHSGKIILGFEKHTHTFTASITQESLQQCPFLSEFHEPDHSEYTPTLYKYTF